MTEAQWLACDDPGPMLEFLRGKASDRKLRLFAVACCRRIYHLLPDKPSSRKAIEFAERFADGKASVQDLHGQAWGKESGAYPAVLYSAWDAAQTAAAYGAGLAARAIAAQDSATEARWQAAFEAAWRQDGSPSEAQAAANAAVSDAATWLAARETARTTEGREQASVLRDVFPNPFRPLPAIDPAVLAWNGGAVVRLARDIYEGRSFDRLTELGGMLEHAGSTDQDIIGHCRVQGRVHARGCWLVDRLLGKG